jgi:arylsulfatase A-like enzyme
MSMDLMPTMLVLAGVEAPDDRPLDGVDLGPVLFDGKPLAERQLFWQRGSSQAMRDGDWKLVRGARGVKGTSLFNLAADPGEQNNLAGKHPDRVAAMEAALDRFAADVAEGATVQPDTK